MINLQKAGGVAALFHATAYVVGIVLGFAFIFPLLGAETGRYLAFITENQGLIYIWNLVSYWVAAIALVVLALALYDRLKAGSPALAQVATVFGLIWAGLIIGSGNLMLHNLGIIADLYSQNPAQAETVWLALDAVENGITSGNELVGSLWILLLSLAALRTSGLPRALNYLGMIIGVAGIFTIVPVLTETMIMIFAPGMIVWSVWVGIFLLRRSPSEVKAGNPAGSIPQHSPTG